MKDMTDYSDLEVGFDVPAVPGMDEAEVQTPCLVLDLDALERRGACGAHGGRYSNSPGSGACTATRTNGPPSSRPSEVTVCRS